MGLTFSLRLLLAMLGAAVITVVVCLLATFMGRERNVKFHEPVTPVQLAAYKIPEVEQKMKRLEPEKEPPPMRVKTPRHKRMVEPEKLDLAVAPLQFEMPRVLAATIPIAPPEPQQQQPSGFGATGIYDVGNVDTPPRLQRYAPPVYPARAKGRKIEGEVLIRCIVTTGGRVKDAEIIHADPPGYFERVALASVVKWTFVAARNEGKKVPVVINIPVTFKLD